MRELDVSYFTEGFRKELNIVYMYGTLRIAIDGEEYQSFTLSQEETLDLLNKLKEIGHE